MKRIIFPLIALGLILASFTSYSDEDFNVGDLAPMMDYEMKNTNDGVSTLQGAKLEKGVVVVFSCNTCPFVVGNKGFEGWEVQYNELHKLATKNGLGFVLVNSNEAKRDGDDSMDEMKKHGEELGYTMEYLMDINSELANAFGAKTTPHVFVINSDNHLVYKGSIDNTWDTKRETDIPYLKNTITEITNNKRISTPETAPKGCSIKRV